MCRNAPMTLCDVMAFIITIETLHFVEKGPERARGAHGAYKESIKEKTVDPTDVYRRFGHEDDRSDLANQGCINSPKLMHPTAFYYFKLVSYIWRLHNKAIE